MHMHSVELSPPPTHPYIQDIINMAIIAKQIMHRKLVWGYNIRTLAS